MKRARLAAVVVVTALVVLTTWLLSSRDARAVGGVPARGGAGPSLVSYLAGCALDRDDSIVLSPNGVAEKHDGYFGLASSWKTSTPTEEEQRWLSACLLARTNAFGRKVFVQLRGAHPKLGMPVEAPAVEEGAFYGDVFQKPAVMYACEGERRGTSAALADRVCADRDGDGTKTRCGFVYEGRCSDVCERDPSTGYYRRCRGGERRYEEVVTVYLAP